MNVNPSSSRLARVALKICGLTSPVDAILCADAGAAALGAVFFPPSPRNVSPERAAEVFANVPTDVARVGVFVDASASDILRAAHVAGLSVAQLHGSEPPALAAKLIAEGLAVLKVLRSGDLAAEAARFPRDTRFLVECGRGTLPGGNGAAWDWSAAHALAPLPFAIAGGLSPDNLATAAAASGACFFDLSSAVESAPGRKDAAKVRAAIDAVRKAGGNSSFLARSMD